MKARGEKKTQTPNFESLQVPVWVEFSIKYDLLRTIGWKYTPELFKTITWSQIIGAHVWIFISLGCCGIPWHNTNENIVQTQKSLFTCLYIIWRQRYPSKLSELFLLFQEVSLHCLCTLCLAVCMCCEVYFEMEKNYSCLYGVLLFYLGGKSPKAEWCGIVNISHRNSEINMDWFAWEKFHEKAGAECHWGIKVVQWANQMEKDLSVFGEQYGG